VDGGRRGRNGLIILLLNNVGLFPAAKESLRAAVGAPQGHDWPLKEAFIMGNLFDLAGENMESRLKKPKREQREDLSGEKGKAEWEGKKVLSSLFPKWEC